MIVQLVKIVAIYWKQAFFCLGAGKCVLDKEAEMIPDWCPLMDLPKKIMEIIQPIRLMLALWRAGISVLMRLQEEILMIDLTGKRVFVRTQEEYLSVLKMAKLQGFKWARGEKLDAINIPIPNLLNFYDDIVTYYSDDIPLFEASEIVACEEKIKEAIAHVKYFANNKYRMSLTDKVIDSMLLLADTVESQMEEVK